MVKMLIMEKEKGRKGSAQKVDCSGFLLYTEEDAGEGIKCAIRTGDISVSAYGLAKTLMESGLWHVIYKEMEKMQTEYPEVKGHVQ